MRKESKRVHGARCTPQETRVSYDKNSPTRYSNVWYGVSRIDLSLWQRINVLIVRNVLRENCGGKKENVASPAINAEFNYQLSLSIPFLVRSSPVEVASNGLATSGGPSVFSTPIFLSFLPPGGEYPRSSADINWPKPRYDRASISIRLRQPRFIRLSSICSWLNANSFALHAWSRSNLPSRVHFCRVQNTSSAYVTSSDASLPDVTLRT